MMPTGKPGDGRGVAVGVGVTPGIGVSVPVAVGLADVTVVTNSVTCPERRRLPECHALGDLAPPELSGRQRAFA
jgi:hypothetical protein